MANCACNKNVSCFKSEFGRLVYVLRVRFLISAVRGDLTDLLGRSLRSFSAENGIIDCYCRQIRVFLGIG
jgi:hypothetical protein